MNKLMKPLDRLPFLLGAIPFFLAGYDAFQMNDWGFGTANLVLGTLNLLTSIWGARFSIVVNSLLLVLDVLMAAGVSYYFYVTETKGLPYFWAIITAGYFIVFMMYRMNTASALQESSSPESRN